MVVHPANGHTSGTLVNAIMYHCQGNLSGINGVMRPGIVQPESIKILQAPFWCVKMTQPTVIWRSS